MNRRTFIRNIGLAVATSQILPAFSLNTHTVSKNPFSLLNSFTLKEFENEHEEYPNLVSDEKGGSWLFSLRRLSYPDDKELISAFVFNNGNWEEQAPVTPRAGQYEYPVASCAPGGKPVIAWTSIEDGQWVIRVATGEKEGFGAARVFTPQSGKFIKPVLITPKKGKAVLAWECLDQGHFSIYVAQYAKGKWQKPQKIAVPGKSLFDPAMTLGKDGKLYLAYSITDGVHQNIAMKILNDGTVEDTVPVAIGGAFTDRVNMNTNPALAFDSTDRLWISWENNRRSHRLEDGDNFTGDRICAMVCYENGKIMEPESGKWLFDGKNDQLPTFVKDHNNQLYAFTHCGGDFTGNPFWKYRVSKLNTEKGWSEPVIVHETSQKGETARPSVIFGEDNSCWLATRPEKWFAEELAPGEVRVNERRNRTRLSKLELHQLQLSLKHRGSSGLQLKPSIVEEHHPNEDFVPKISGRPWVARKTMTYKGEQYTLVVGNLHEHSEISSCWPAGCDGTLHDDYRFGIYSEGYDFMGITDHGYALSEVYWRKSLRMTDFYSEQERFVALPSLEWTLSNGKGNVEIKSGVGHKNIIFPSKAEAHKAIRNKNEIYSVNNDETKDAGTLWKFLHKHNIDCISIPHHPADEVHPTDWEIHDEKYQPIVEIFQCRGNAEYPGCPRELNVTRHKPIDNPKGFINYALAEKKYKLGFVASGDHNGIGVGLAAVWVKEVSAEGIVDALKNRRCYATTGDKIFVHLSVNGAWGNDVARYNGKAPEIAFEVETTDKIKALELLRNSEVIQQITPSSARAHKAVVTDENFDGTAAYYYLRVIQENGHIGWSSPVWVEV